jgi:hypothetical protein
MSAGRRSSVRFVRRPSSLFAESDGPGLRHRRSSSNSGQQPSPPPPTPPQQQLELVDEQGAVLPTPQGLRNVIESAKVRDSLVRHRFEIMGALAAWDSRQLGACPQTVFRQIMMDEQLQLGLTPTEVEDLLQSLLFIGRLGQARGVLAAAAASDDGGGEDILYKLLFQQPDGGPEIPPGVLLDERDFAQREEDAAAAAPLPPQLVLRPVAVESGSGAEQQQRQRQRGGDADAGAVPGSADRLAELHEQRQAAAKRFRLPSVEVLERTSSLSQLLDGEEEEEGGGEGGGSGDLAAAAAAAAAVRSPAPEEAERDDSEEDEIPGTVPAPASPPAPPDTLSYKRKARQDAARQFRLPSLEDLLIDSVSDRGSLPIVGSSFIARKGHDTSSQQPGRLATEQATNASNAATDDAHIAMNLQAYLSIGMIAVFFCSLSLSTINAYLPVARGSIMDTEESSWLQFFLAASFATHALVVVLNIFTVLSMSMIYYYGSLHIGHGLAETAAVSVTIAQDALSTQTLFSVGHVFWHADFHI